MSYPKRICPKCLSEYTPTDGYLYRGKRYPTYRCKKCMSKYACSWAKKNPERKQRTNKVYLKRNPKVLARKNKSYRNRHPEKTLAHALVRYELDTGRMKRLPCEVCKNKRANAHHDDYSKPLLVRWLCTKHHIEHHMLNKGGKKV